MTQPETKPESYVRIDARAMVEAIPENTDDVLLQRLRSANLNTTGKLAVPQRVVAKIRALASDNQPADQPEQQPAGPTELTETEDDAGTFEADDQPPPE